MEHFPIFLDLKGRRVVVCGGGELAAQKIELLIRAGARVLVIAPAISPVIGEWIAAGACDHGGAEFRPDHLTDAVLVIAATGDERVARTVSAAAQARHLPVNVVDRPELCSFIMPAIVERAPVTVAISTAGRSPTLAKLVRARIEALLPDGLGKLAEIAGAMRPLVRRLVADEGQRRRFWHALLDGPVADLTFAGHEAEAEEAAIAALEDAANATADGAQIAVLRRRQAR